MTNFDIIVEKGGAAMLENGTRMRLEMEKKTGRIQL